MKIFKGLLIAWIVFISAFSIPPVRFMMISQVLIPAVRPRMFKNDADSKLVLNEFYVRSQSKDYAQAHLLLSSSLRSTLTVQSLKQQWQAFEQVHGSIKNWKSVSGGKTSMWPDYVDAKHTVGGTKNGAGKVSVRMVPENGTWRIDQLKIQP
jgi:hypothetical protein